MARVFKFVISDEDQIQPNEPDKHCKQIEGNFVQLSGSPSDQSTENTSDDCDLMCEVKDEDVQKADHYCKEKLDNCELKRSDNQDKFPANAVSSLNMSSPVLHSTPSVRWSEVRCQLDVTAGASPTLDSIREVVRQEISIALAQSNNNRPEQNKEETKQMKKEVLIACRSLAENDEAMEWDYSKIFLHPSNVPVTEKLKTMVQNVVSPCDQRLLKQRIKKLYLSKKRMFNERANGKLMPRQKRMRGLQRWKALTERRRSALPELRSTGMTEEQKSNVERLLTGQPRKKSGSDLVSSDESCQDVDGDKVFKKKAIRKRSKNLELIFERLDKIARNKAAKSGTNLFKRIPSELKSKRSMPMSCPDWMLSDSDSG